MTIGSPVAPFPGSACPWHAEPPPGCVNAPPPAIRPLWLRVVTWLAVFIGAQVALTLMAAGLLVRLSPAGLDAGTDLFIARNLIPLSLVSTAAGISVTLFFWRRIDRRSLASLGVPLHSGVPEQAWKGALAAVWLMTLASLPALIAGGGRIRLLPGGVGFFTLGLVLYGIVFLLVSANEELAFRGYLFRNLLLRVKPWLAVVVSSVVFAAMHSRNPHLTPLAYLNLHLAGALLALSLLRWGSLWFAIGFHLAWNLYQAVILTLPVSGIRLSGLLDVPVSGPGWLTGGAFGPEGSLLTTLLLGVACLRMGSGLPIALNQAPEAPPCASGETCPLVPEEIAAAARRGGDPARRSADPGPGPTDPGRRPTDPGRRPADLGRRPADPASWNAPDKF